MIATYKNCYLDWICPHSGERFCDSLAGAIAPSRTIGDYVAWAEKHGIERYSVVARKTASPDGNPILYYRGEPLANSPSVEREAKANLAEGIARG